MYTNEFWGQRHICPALPPPPAGLSAEQGSSAGAPRKSQGLDPRQAALTRCLLPGSKTHGSGSSGTGRSAEGICCQLRGDGSGAGGGAGVGGNRIPSAAGPSVFRLDGDCCRKLDVISPTFNLWWCFYTGPGSSECVCVCVCVFCEENMSMPILFIIMASGDSSNIHLSSQRGPHSST